MNPKSPAPDIVIVNAAIATQNPRRPIAQALAIGQGQILAVGDNNDMLHMVGAGVEKIDLDGRLVVPGFIDTHIHFYEWALKRQGVKLDDLTCLEGLLARVRQAAENRPPGQWIMGQGWNETDWSDPRMPTRKALDQVVPNHPVLLWRCDLHLAAANSAALKLAGIDTHTPDPPEGRIERSPEGEPTGILRELAINLVRKVVAMPDFDQVMQAFADASGALHRRGITGIHDVRLMADKDGAASIQAFQKMEQEGRLALRSWVTLSGDRLDDIIGLGLRTGFGNERLRVGHVKFFADGGMGARTAWMIDPFLDAGCGMPLMDMNRLADDIRRADAAGLSAMVHAVGDRANREIINLFQDLKMHRTHAGIQQPRIPHRNEHVQMIRPEDTYRLRDLNVALCVTPANMVLDINLIDSAVGEKGRWAYAFRELMDTGAPVMFSSDCPVCDPDPLVGIHAAVTRQRADGTPQDGWHPQNRVRLTEAIGAYTVVPAAVHHAHDIGAIAPGKKADLAVLSENMLTAQPSRIPHIKVDMTFFDGNIVYRRM